MTFNLPTTNKKGKSFYRGLAAGYRSGLEETIAEQLRSNSIEVLYETDRIQYTIPARQSKYTPDFKLPKLGGFFFVETKGIWTVQDRAKHLLIQKQHPDIDIRFVFSNAAAKLYKGSQTTYANYCNKHGFLWAHKVIPDQWISECVKGLNTKSHLKKS